jgi:hypothetical protein
MTGYEPLFHSILLGSPDEVIAGEKATPFCCGA